MFLCTLLFISSRGYLGAYVYSHALLSLNKSFPSILRLVTSALQTFREHWERTCEQTRYNYLDTVQKETFCLEV